MTELDTADQPAKDRDPPAGKPERGCVEEFVICLLSIIVLGLAMVAVYSFFERPRIYDRSRMMQAANNARQILISLKSYASDHNGRYPEGATSNDAFRELFKAAVLDDERAFTAYHSPYQPDGNIGDAPDFEETLKPDENHWAMTKGLTDNNNGDIPLVFENPAVASWPPYWDASVGGAAKPGRAWKSGKVIIGRNDGSVGGQQLTDDHSQRVTLAPSNDGKKLFESAGPHEVMDVSR